MKTFEFEVTRVSCKVKTISVIAETADEAYDKIEQEAYNTDFSDGEECTTEYQYDMMD